MKIKRHNKIYSFLLAILFISAGFLFLGSTALASEIKWYEAVFPIVGAWNHGSDIATIALNPVDSFLSMILGFVGLLLNIALKLFSWAIDGETVRGILTADPIYQTWTTVRDLCNIGFILILLFSAFATVFQYSKYNYKNILMWLVIMALLVNFSYPIALFIIDVSNSLMYTILGAQFGSATGGSLVVSSSDGSPFSAIQHYIDASDGHSETKVLLFMIIFVFILALTILALGLILFIRTIALAIIIILSPIGFVGTIINKDGGWWGHLFKYAMAGPIIALVLLISIRLMAATAAQPKFNDDVLNASIIDSAASFIMPIVILWMGMAMAVKGIDGAGAILGKAQGIAKAAGRQFSGYNTAKGQIAAFSASRKKRRDEIDKKKWGSSIGDRANDAQDSIYAALGSKEAQKRKDKRRTTANKDDIDKGAKDLVDSGHTTDSLTSNLSTNFATVTATSSKEEKKEHAKYATAYMRQDADERKMDIQNSISAAGGMAGSRIDNIVNGFTPTGLSPTAHASFMNSRNEANLAAANIAAATAGGTAPTENDIRKVSAFMNSQLKRKVDLGANAQ
ncbi:MAG: hypothetical protein WC823_05625 [Parcubacteria group bacterium]